VLADYSEFAFRSPDLVATDDPEELRARNSKPILALAGLIHIFPLRRDAELSEI
jgi:hypothetical protein